MDVWFIGRTLLTILFRLALALLRHTIFGGIDCIYIYYWQCPGLLITTGKDLAGKF